MNVQETINHYLNNDLLTKMLDESCYPESLRQWRIEELRMLTEIVEDVGPAARVVDFGCGDGLHLRALRSRIGFGLGIDIDPAAIETAQAHEATHRNRIASSLQYLVASMDDPKIQTATEETMNTETGNSFFEPFDIAYCMFSTILAAIDPGEVFRQMNSLLKLGGVAVVSVYNDASCEDRIGWYTRIGEGKLIEKTRYHLKFDSGFISGYATLETAIELFGEEVTIEPCLDFGSFISSKRY